MKFLTKEVKIAIATIVAAILVFIGINFLKGINVFKSSNTYYVLFDDVAGLAISNAVYANGYPVGVVRTIDYDYSSTHRVVVGVELDEAMRVPAQTRAELESELMGGVKMNLVLGPNPTEHLTPGDTLRGGLHQGAMAQLSAMVPTVVQLMPKLDSIMTNVQRLTGDSALIQTLQNAAVLTAELAQTSHTINTLMQRDVPQLTANLKSITTHLNKVSGDLAATDLAATLQNVDTTLQQAKQLSAQLNEMTTSLEAKMNGTDNTLGLFLNDRGVYDNLNSTLRHADSLMMDLKAHPSRYVHFSVFGKKEKK